MRQQQPTTSRRLGIGILAPEQGLTRLLLLVFVVSAVANILFGLVMAYRSSPVMLDADEQEYWQLGRRLVEQGLFEPGRRTPLFPLVVGLLQAGLGSFLAVSVAISLIASLAAPLLALVVVRISDNRMAALLAGLGLALWPTALFFGASIYSETLALPLFLLFLVLLPPARDPAAWTGQRLVVAGLVLGLAAFARTMYVLFLPVLGLILWIDRRSLVGAVRAFLPLLAGVMVVAVPWSAYASYRTGHVMLFSSNGGETLAGGFNEALIRSEGREEVALERRTVWVGPGKWLPPYQTGLISPAELRLDYLSQDRLLRERTVAWILAHPDTAGYILVRKLAYMWGYYPWRQSDLLKNLVGNVPILLLQALFAWALFASPVARRHGARLYLLPMFVVGVATISWGSWRFREPADAGMIAVVSIALVEAWARRRGKAALAPSSDAADETASASTAARAG